MYKQKHSPNVVYRFHPTMGSTGQSLRIRGCWWQCLVYSSYIVRGTSGLDLELTWLLVLPDTGVPTGWDLRCSGALKMLFPKSFLLFFGIESLLKCGMLLASLCQFSFVARQIAEVTRLSASLQAVAVIHSIMGAMWINVASTVTQVW